MQDTGSNRTVVAVVNDLMFGSRIRAAAQQAGVDVAFVRNAGDLAARAAHADLVLLDLETRWLDAPAAIRSLRSDAATEGVPVVAFGPHVAGEALKAAREAGAHRVLARSAFVAQLQDLMRG